MSGSNNPMYGKPVTEENKRLISDICASRFPSTQCVGCFLQKLPFGLTQGRTLCVQPMAGGLGGVKKKK
jgi:hypothetical protein